MATSTRRPLSTRQRDILCGPSPQKVASRTQSSTKRPRSPESAGDGFTLTQWKRVKAVPPGSTISTIINDEERMEKEQKRLAREMAKNEFRFKYTRAFPTFVFYFDLDQLDLQSATLRNSLVARVTQLGARVDDFFSNEVTHLITDEIVPTEDATSNKENAQRMRTPPGRPLSFLRSPIKFKGRIVEDGHAQNFSIVDKALAFGIKIWNTTKLDSVLERCDAPASASAKQIPNVQPVPAHPITNQRCLTRLLASERLHGSAERDPTQKRHDFRYFSKHSCFVLVEDVKQELATIHALEYPVTKGRDGTERGAWPILYCHPDARGPFIEFDERERRRWEKSRRAEEDRARELQLKATRESAREKRTGTRLGPRIARDLRRSVSMNNLHRQVTNGCVEGFIDLDAGSPNAQPSASGYLASTCTSTYVAASGNSVAVASTTGTTSTTGGTLFRIDLPASLRGRLQSQIITSRKASSLGTGAIRDRKPGAMGPPDSIPEQSFLKKSRSTNMLRLPKRDEGTKPGYCESCRVKFDDFELHIRERKHRKFAEDDSNYLQLDFLLDQVRRRARPQCDENVNISE
ncbi:hypothetical protein ID866_6392 [Astraeus odoratus]|nr:hypothetical protein ID866_6392 [Astraeus odoratus]